MHQNNIFFIFLKLFLTSKQSKNIEKKLILNQKKFKFVKNTLSINFQIIPKFNNSDSLHLQ
jgi:hypothetical protein